ncbi:MAG TPA: hypothetical protein VMB48_12895 [Steroidobacteraceae bacterium]|nr:hypothetical protein [Steroidobacteraceae bacterium]
MEHVKPSTSRSPPRIAPSSSTSSSSPTRIPPNVDVLRNEVAGTLTALVSGHIFGKSAADKARDIARQLPATLLTRDNIARLKEAILNDSHRVEQLLHHTGNQCGGVQERATSRAVLVGKLMLGGLDAALQQKDAVIAMSASERLACLKGTLEELQLAAERPREQSDHLDPDARAPSQVQSTRSDTAGTQSTGTAEYPIAQPVDVQSARALTRRACAHPADEPLPLERFAWIRNPATSTTFVLTDSLGPCVPVIVFWKDARQVQQATLFHFNGWVSKDVDLEHDIKAIMDHTKSTAPSAKIDSVCMVERRMGLQDDDRRGSVEKLANKDLQEFAREERVPYHTFHHDDENMAVIVDVQRFEITTMSSSYLNGFEHPLGNERGRSKIGR